MIDCSLERDLKQVRLPKHAIWLHIRSAIVWQVCFDSWSSFSIFVVHLSHILSGLEVVRNFSSTNSLPFWLLRQLEDIHMVVMNLSKRYICPRWSPTCRGRNYKEVYTPCWIALQTCRCNVVDSWTVTLLGIILLSDDWFSKRISTLIAKPFQRR